MASPERKGRATTLTLCAEAYELLQQLAPGPRQYGATVSRLLVEERVRRETRIEERARVARQLLVDAAGTLVGV
jgi:hypothetical protein